LSQLLHGVKSGEVAVEQAIAELRILPHEDLGFVNYNEERLHSALNYLRPGDYYRGNPEALLAEQERKPKAAAAKRAS
jgi:hypothetical protein